MAKKKHYEFQESNKQFRESDGLKTRKLKTEGRWKFNPNQSYSSVEEEDDIEDDEYQHESRL